MKSSKKRISSVFAVLVMAIVLSCIFAACDKVGEKQVPVYKGMTISRSFATSSAATAAEDNGNHYGHFKGDHDNRNDEVDQNKPFEDPNAPSIENKANSTLDVVGSAESIYYADKNQNVFITIKLSNPDSYEILSFTLNGKKYSNYMFENGSDMENLVLKVNVGDVGGIVEYTIDAIKYVDGTEIKDVRMDGNRTVKAGVRASDQTYVNVTNEKKTMTSISFDAQVVDLYSLIEKSGGYAKAVLYDGVNMLTKDIKVGEKTNIVFDNLTPNTVYQYGVVALYDNLSGNGAKLNTLYKKAVYTDTIVLFKDVQVGKEGIEWGFVWNESFANKQMSAISLWQNGAKVQDVDTGATRLDGLKSNNKYTLKATYKNLQNQDETIAIEFVTYAKAVPTVEIANVQSTQTQVSFELNITDTDNVGAISKIELLHGDDTPIAVENTDRTFANLLTNNDYTIKVTYAYDLNDGVGERQIVKMTSITTKAKAVPTVEIANVQSTQTAISFGLNITDTDNVGAMSKIELLHGDDEPIVAETSDIRAFENLFSNNDYIVKVTYTYDLNDGVGEQQIVKTASIKTKAKAMPSATISNLSSTQSTIECDVVYTDIDSVGSVVEIALYRLENKIKSVPFATHVSFDGLESGKEYKVVVTYKYDLNDGKSEQTATANAKYSTLIDSIVVDSLILLNNNVVKLGEELNLRVYFTNSSEIELTGIYVNGQKTTVVGGDRIESAIVKFVPTTSGLCKFAIDRVDYVINGIEVNQAIDSNVDVEYPIYRDIDITYTPITISKYENTGDGVYISFDNEDGYTVFKVNESDDFVTVDSGRIFTKDISITSIEYGYADYGHTTQSCDFKNDYWNGDIHNVTALKRIYTVEDFFAMTDGYYLLMNDLDLRSVQTKAQIKLTGIFDANGHTIRGLSNVVDTSKYEYFDLFQGGSIYDATFKELYVSVNHTSNGNSLYVRPLGNAKLYNCTVKGDVMLSDSVNYGNLNIADDSTTYSLNVTIGTAMSTQKHTAANTLAKNTHIVERDDVFYFDCEVGKAFLSYANRNTADYTVEDGTFFVRSCAFADSETLRNITMPESVQCTGDYHAGDYSVFENCIIENAVIPIRLLEQLNDEQRKQLVTLSLFGNGVTSIGESAFSGCTGLTSITIPSSVTSIGGSAFQGCTGLTSITIPNSVTSIGWGAFRDCTGLTSVTIPDSVTSIGESAFYNCRGLTSVTIGNSVTNIGDRAFSGCSGLTSVHISDIAKWCATSFGDYDANPLMYAHDLYVNGVLVKDLIIPDSVTSIGDGAFYGCSGLTRVTISKNTTSIGEGAFGFCGNLQYVLYDDTAIRWGQINIESNNDCLMSAKKLYNHDGKTRTYTFVTNSTQENFSMSGLYLDELPVVEKEGYDFCGWYDNQQFDGARITTPYYDDKNIVLYAKWEIIHYTIKYDFGDAMSVSKAQNNPLNPLSYTILDEIEFAKPQRKGYTFVSWDKNILKGTTGEIVVTAQWVVDEYSIEYVLNGWTNSERNKTTYTIEDGNITLYDATHDGSLFCGWYLDEACKDFVEIISADELKNYTVYTNPTNFATAGLSIQNDTITGYNGTEKEVSIPSYYRGKPVLKIGKDAFNSNANIRKVVIPYGITVIGDSAFYCSGLTSLDIPDSVHTIEYAAFMGCFGIDVLCIPNSVKTVEDAAFKGLGIESLTIPNGWETIGINIFSYCNKLTSVTIPDSVTKIEDAFYCCDNIKTVYFTGDITAWCGIDGLENVMSDTTSLYINGIQPSGELVISESVTAIPSYAFVNCVGLTSVTIPDSVTSIGDNAFRNCSGLTSITIPDSVTSIGNYAFQVCSGLTSATIGNRVASIGKYAFDCCKGLTSITIPDSVKSIDSHAFSGCTGITSVKIGNGVISIGEYAFYDCMGLTSITIPDSVTSIGDYAFYYCTGLTSVTIGNSVMSIGNSAFGACSSLTSITIPDSVTSIGSYAFQVCSGLTSVTIGNRVTSIGSGAFGGCTGLTSVTISDSVKSIGDYAFSGCTGLMSITIPDSVTSIGSSAFEGCSSLTSINFKGIIEQWNAIAKGKDWNYNIKQIVCTDGTITLSEG